MNLNTKNILINTGLFVSLFLAMFFFLGMTVAKAETGHFEFGGPFPISMDYSGVTPGECDYGSAQSPSFSIDATNTTNDSYRIVYAAFHSNVAGCEPTSSVFNLSGFSIVGKTEFAAKESGHFDIDFDASTYSCGRVQYDAGYINNVTGEVTLFLGQVINYGVDCPNPPPTCTENASVVVTSPLPSTMIPGETYSFTIQSTNTGNTKWYHGSYFELSNKSGNLNINPTYGHLPYVMDGNSSSSWTFSVVAPSTPGNYSLDFQMMHKAGADYIKSDGTRCAAPSMDKYFGNSVTLNSSVAIPVYSLTTTQAGTGSGTVTGTGSYDAGTTATLTATPSLGSTFVGWGAACSGTNPTTQVLMNSDKTCVTTFDLNTYTITATSGVGGSVTPAGVTTKNYGTNQSYAITPATNYHIGGVLVDGVSIGSVSAYTFSNITANHTISATFAIDQFPLTVNMAGTGAGVVTGAGTYDAGATITVTATPNYGSVFTGWSGACSGTNSSTQVVMNSAKTCTANFNLISAITVSLGANPASMTLPTNSTTLTWATTGSPTSCTATGGWAGSKTSTGGLEVISGLTAGTYTYTITCSKAGTADTSSSVTVTVSNYPLPTVTLTANPTSVAYNASSTLTWTSTNATTCTATGGWSGTKATSGSEIQNNLTTNKSYTITCTGLGGTASSVTNVTVEGVPTSNLSILKTSDKSTANVGDTVTYTLTLTNNGPDSATGVTVTDLLHSGLNFISASTSTGTYATSTGLWTVGNLANNASTTLSIITTIKSGLEGQTIPNTAKASSTKADPTPGDNTSTVNVVVNGVPPCTVNCGPVNQRPVITLIGANPASVNVGEIYNDPGATALDPEDGNITSNIISTSTVNTAIAGSYTVTYNVSDSQGLAAVPVSRTVNVLEITPEVKGKITFCIMFADSNNIIATSSYGLPSGLFSSSLATSTNIASSSIQTKIWNTNAFSPNKKVILNGFDADCVTYDNLALGNYYYSQLGVTGSSWTTPKYNDQFSQSVNNIFDFFTYSPELFTATTTDDVNRNQNADGSITLALGNTDKTLIMLVKRTAVPNPTANLSISKTADKSTASVGDTVTYTLNLVNNGPDNATNVKVTDNLHAGLNFVSATSTLGSYATTTGVWTIGNLNNASSTTLTLVATIKAGYQGQRIPNTATVTSTEVDPTPGDDTTTVNVDVNNPNPPCTANCGGGGGGGGNGPITPNNLTIFNEQVVETVPGIAFVSWNTNLPATRRVVWGNTSNPVVGTAPNYGYPNSTETVSSPLLTAHGMVVGGIQSNKTYYFREISTDILNGVTRTVVGKEVTLNPGTGPTSCYYLYDYLRKDFNNNPVEVRKLQVFLRDLEGFSTVQITGVYDDQTIVALDAFQERYKGDILTPWGHTESTSYTYILTKKKVNEIYCKMAFPVNAQQQQEIDNYRAFLLGLRSAGIVLPGDVTVPPTSTSTTTSPLLNDVIGLGSTTPNVTLAGVSTTTLSKFTANVLFAWNKIGDWTGLNCKNSDGVNCSYKLINWIFLIVIAVISYLWYRERQQNKKIENINKEIDLN